MTQEMLKFLEKVEDYLLKSNIHVDIVEEMMNFLAYKTLQNGNLGKENIIEMLSDQIETMIKKYVENFDIEQNNKPYVMLVCGVNGVGKTTTIGKMANLLKEYEWDIMVAACDTYRAGAENQLRDLVNIDDDDFITAEKDSDNPTKIVLRAYNKACVKNKDVLIIDTSGRLQNNPDLMAELLKMKQKLHELSNRIPHEVVLIIDTNSGYNAMEQAKMYDDLIGITGIIATKVDISKRPGMILSICKKFNIKIFGMCDGEEKDKIKDLDPKGFANAILCDIGTIM